MNEELDRFKLIVDLEKFSLTWLAEETGIKRQRWADVKNGRTKMLLTEGAAVCKLFPEYSYWLITGEEILDAGQISPLTKRAQNLQGN